MLKVGAFLMSIGKLASTPGVREALWELIVLLKNTTKCPQPVLKLGPITSKSSRLIMSPRCFPQTCCLTSTHLILVVCYYLFILDSRNWRSTTHLFSGKRYHFDFDSVFHQLHLFLSSFDLFTELSMSLVIGPTDYFGFEFWHLLENPLYG